MGEVGLWNRGFFFNLYFFFGLEGVQIRIRNLGENAKARVRETSHAKANNKSWGSSLERM